MIKLHKALSYVRQRTFELTHSYVRRRTVATLSLGAILFLTGCATTTSVNESAQGLVSIQSAITCPAPPVHAAVIDPPRHFAAAPHLVVTRDIGYCAYIDTSRGVISVRLRPEYAPKAVADFVYLARQGFYDGLTFYQSCPATTGATCPAGGSFALAGDPSGTGSGGPGYSVASDPVVGDYLFGAVAMYSTNPADIGSQFFISTGDSHTLARRYDIFGQVTDGIPALAEVHKGDTIVWVAILETAPEP
jgi:cyclophilin family peptidyl-prolyl cis-trans isomerase